MAAGDAGEEVCDEGGVVCGVVVWCQGRGPRGRGARPVHVRCVRWILLLEIGKPVGDLGRLDARRYLHASSWNVTKEVPPFGMMGEGGIGHPCYEARNIKKVINLGEVCVRKGVPSKAPKNSARRERASREDSLSDFSAGSIMAKENNTLLGKESIDENNDGMSVCARSGQMGVKRERLSRRCMRC